MKSVRDNLDKRINGECARERGKERKCSTFDVFYGGYIASLRGRRRKTRDDGIFIASKIDSAASCRFRLFGNGKGEKEA